MKYSAFIILISSFIFWLSGCSTSSVDQNFNPDEVITPGVIKKHVFFLASDSLMGRATPSRELDSAASYISREFSSSGVLPVKGSYFQKIKFGKISLASDNYLKIRFNGKEKSFTIKSEFTPFEMTADKEVSAPVVFAGYGITAPEYNYDDYKNIDVKGKVVFVLKHEPGENDTISLFDGAYPTKYSQVDTKVKIAREHGAVGMIMATDPLNHTLLTPTGFPWPSLSKFIPKDALPVTIIENEEDKIPVVHAGQEVISELFGSVDSLRKLQKTIDQTFRGCSFELPEVNVSVKTSTEISGQPAYNVVGLIEGSDPKLKEEIVVVGAHYDHVGYKKNHESGTDYIFNGADDNASGTAAIIALS
ncbi:MAG: M28 family peptidase, partial [Bacillota bacterium]